MMTMKPGSIAHVLHAFGLPAFPANGPAILSRVPAPASSSDSIRATVALPVDAFSPNDPAYFPFVHALSHAGVGYALHDGNILHIQGRRRAVWTVLLAWAGDDYAAAATLYAIAVPFYFDDSWGDD